MNLSRYGRKGPSIKSYITVKLKNSKIPIKIFARNSTITPKCVGFKFLIHNGKLFTPLEVTSSMIGHKFGEFSFTRQKYKHNK